MSEAIVSVPIPHHGDKPFTDYSRWRLRLGPGGRHTWHYLKSEQESMEWPQTDIDRYWLGLSLDSPPLPLANDAFQAARNGFSFFKRLQAPDGHWPGEYGGPMFLLPGFVIGSYVSGLWFEEEERLEMIRYLLNRAHPGDGGWGIHIEGQSTVLGTALNYATMRLLGVDRDHPAMVKSRNTLHVLGEGLPSTIILSFKGKKRFELYLEPCPMYDEAYKGGAAAVPSWGKFWLTILNVYEWGGNNPIPPELWLLPEWLPIHPHRWWIHTRAVYLPMSYLFRVKFQGPETPIVLSLREELYTEPYESIDWPAQRNNIAKVDLYTPHTPILDILNFILSSTLESCVFPPLQRKALARAYDLICMEDENTAYQDLAPVSKMMQVVCRKHAEGAGSDPVKLHGIKRSDFMWMSPEGMEVCGTNGSQLWDTTFIAQALVETGLADVDGNKESLLRVLDWLDQAQMTENPTHHKTAYRQATKGAWGFSTKEQGYTLTDCTGEGLKAVLYLQKGWPDSPKPISDERIFDSVDLLLSMQCADGGFASYEKIRAPKMLELINPAEVFGNIMVEYTYPECTTSVITALSIFRKYYPDYRTSEIDCVIRGAVKFIHKAQRSEGGWYGSWGICFTYATMFALESLALVGETYATSHIVRKACEFLLGKQMHDGGWGESYKSCELETYVSHEQSQVVQTSWAVLALMYAQYPHHEPIKRGVALVMSRQQRDGSWAQEAIEGVFNKNCAISYPNFKHSFSIWMLGKAHKYLSGSELR